MDVVTLSLAKKYVDDTANGLGAVKGSPATIESITPVDGGNEVVFAWIGADGTKQTQMMFVENGSADCARISILESDPAEPQEGQMWILKSSASKMTTPVIELGKVGENSIEFMLSNASFDGSGAVVATYNIYVNGVLNKTENIEPGGICTIDGLSAGIEYQVSVRGVNGDVLSEASNTLTAATPDVRYVHTVGDGNCVAVYGSWPRVIDGIIQIDASTADRAAILSLTGDTAYKSNGIQGTYYPFAIPADATSVTVNCPSGSQYSFNGYTVTDGKYERTVDSGYKSPNTIVTFEAGKCQYGYAYIKKSSGEFAEGDLAGITVTFA